MPFLNILPGWWSRWLLIPVFSFQLLLASCQQPEPPRPDGPNILLIVADDLGYSDLGCFGGEINTPVIDGLAEQGIRFSRFYTSPICSPTRAMLLSGNDNHIAGIGVQNYRSDQFGYEGELSDRIVPIPELLRQAGYNTYISGKWHLGMGPENDPVRKGFDKSYVSILGASNHFNGNGLLMDEPNIYTENGKPASWPDGRFSSDVYTDKLIEFLRSGEQDGKPFFAFAAYTAPHWPLQVEDRYRMKYEGRYDDGYETLRQERMDALKSAGIIPPDVRLPELHPLVTPWDSLSAEQKQTEARKMELYAGMVDNLDENVGRLISYLKESGKYENTLIIFMSDNGAGDEDYYNHEYFSDFLQERYDNSFENMGSASSFVSCGPPWAEASTAPFRYFKGYLTEGGIRAPMILTGPLVKRHGIIHDGLVTVMDLAPTFYQAAGADYPETDRIYPLTGKSLLPYASAATNQIHAPDYRFALEHNGRTMLQQADWKLMQNDYPLTLEKFELYNLQDDLGEQENLENSEPARYDQLLQAWDHFYRVIHGMLPPD